MPELRTDDRPATTEMRMLSIVFDRDENIATVTVVVSEDVSRQLRRILGDDYPEGSGVLDMPIADCAAAGRDAGKWSPASSPDWDATHAIYECLVYGVFNRFWEDGLNGFFAGEDLR